MPRAPTAFALAACALTVLVALQGASTVVGVRTALAPDENVGLAPAPEAVDTGNAKAVEATDNAKAVRATGPLIAAPNFDHAIFANLIAARLRREGTTQISAVGPGPSYMAFKALIIANRYMAKAFPGKVLAVLPSMHGISLKSGLDATGYLLEVLPVPKIDVLKDADTLAGVNTNAGLLAGFISRRFRDHDTVTIGAMGPKAVYSVLKATVYAEAEMSDDEEAERVQLALVPTFQRFDRDGTTLSRMLLTCVYA